jgi:amino acid transporter
MFAELAAMFPNKPGGIALYAHEGWRRYFTPIGALAAVGYWAGWSLGLAVYGLIIGQLLATQFFPHSAWTVFDGTQHIGLAVFLAGAAIVAVWALNVFGIRPAVTVNKLIGVVVCVTIAILVAGPFVTGHWHDRLSWGLATRVRRGVAGSWRSSTSTSGAGRPTGPRSRPHSRPNTVTSAGIRRARCCPAGC